MRKPQGEIFYQPNLLYRTNPIIRYLKFQPLTLEISKRPKTPEDNGYYFKMNSDIKLIKHLLLDNGFLETNSNYDFTIYWNVGPIKNEVYQTLNYYQRVTVF